MDVDEAIRILRSVGCPEDVIEHCLTVRNVALELADKIEKNGYSIDKKLVELGALFHDIGRAITHGISHGVVGGRILRDLDLDRLAPFAENHIGGGIPAEEAANLGLPPKDYFPNTIEEKIVAYADKLVEGGRVVNFERSLEEFKKELGKDHPAIERLLKLHREMKNLIGKSYPEPASDEALRESP
ncbi:MAG: TIGR00295 family protein [Candidatus Hadarchaeales archaeon]